MSIFSFDQEATEPHSEPQSFATLDFYDNLLFGYIFKTIIWQLLGRCGYEVTPFGYESTLPHLTNKLHGIKSTETAMKLRYTPDLVVRNPDDGQVNLVEVKARSASGRCGIAIKEIGNYQKYWSESILVLIVAGGEYFYARQIRELTSSQGIYVLDDFRLFEDIFPRLVNLGKEFRLKQVRKVITLFRERQRCNL